MAGGDDEAGNGSTSTENGGAAKPPRSYLPKHPGEFNPSEESWSLYMTRFKIFLGAGDDGAIPESRRGLVLLSGLGPKTVELLSNLVTAKDIAELSVVEIDDALKGHFHSHECLAAHRFKYWKRDQQSGEPLKDYVSEIRHLALACKFGNSLDEMLRDKLIFGIRSTSTQKRLLAEDMTFKQAEDLARALESAEKNALEMQSSGTGDRWTGNGSEVQAVTAQGRRQQAVSGRSQWDGAGSRTSGRRGSRAANFGREPSSSEDDDDECTRCGGKHPTEGCRHRDSRCHDCGRRGHLARVCNANRGAERRRFNYVRQEEEDDFARLG